MTMSDPNGKPSPGPLARIGQSDSAAGLSRIGIALMTTALAAILAWGASDIRAMIARIDENQKAIIAIGDRTTHVEDAAANARDAAAAAVSSGREFRTWTEGRVNDLTSGINADARQINDIDRKQEMTTNRVRCLENRTRCPP